MLESDLAQGEAFRRLGGAPRTMATLSRPTSVSRLVVRRRRMHRVSDVLASVTHDGI